MRLSDLLLAALNGETRPAAIGLQGLCAGVAIHDNLLVANEGIRSETSGRGNEDGVPQVALTAALRIEHNLLYCQSRGISLAGHRPTSTCTASLPTSS